MKTLLTALVLLFTVTLLQAQSSTSTIINTPSFPYTWTVSGQSYAAPGMYYYTDPASGVVYMLDLRSNTAFLAPGNLSYTFNGNNFYTYTVPKTAWYLLDASGAQGGPSGSKTGGKGARVQGYVRLLTGQQLRIAVGGSGAAGSNDGSRISGGGGGGSSSIVLVNGTTYTPLLIAGGGGGAAKNYDGSPGLITNNGGFAWGGTAGSGGGLGTNSSKYGGAGGAGYNSDGGTHCDGNCTGSNELSRGGQAYIGGNSGGNSGNRGGDGGWGGGGEGGPAKSAFANNHDGGGGGGGGYSGGGGGTNDGDGGGGGGSFRAPNVFTTGTQPVEGIQAGNGLVTLERLDYEIVEPCNNTYSFQGNTFQYFTAPASGFYKISASGAQGGGYNNAVSLPGCTDPLPTNYTGGKGAKMEGYAVFKKGDTYKIAVGGMGGGMQWNGNTEISPPCGEVAGAGGGGASSIVLVKDDSFAPVMIAGGGGGASSDQNGVDATTATSGTSTLFYEPGGLPGVGGVNGNGGTGPGGGAGAGYFTDGAPISDIYQTPANSAEPGQAYVNGNYGGVSPTGTGSGGWGGGGSGPPWYIRFNTSTYFGNADGPGGGGGGYSGGGGGQFRNIITDFMYGGGGGGSFSAVFGGQADSTGVNTGNGLVTIYGPNVSTENITVPGPSYTWPANGVTYYNAGSWSYVDKDNFVVRVLNLSFGSPGNCSSYVTSDTTVVSSTNSFFWFRNGRTYTENIVDSMIVGCNKYILRLTVYVPITSTAPIGGCGSGSLRIINAGEPEAVGLLQTTLGYDWQAKRYVACKNSTADFTMAEVPFATSYQWLLPAGASGSSTTNSITVNFGSAFSGGSVCVVPINAIGAGDTLCMSLGVALSPPTGQLSISFTPDPKISGYYKVTPIAGATTYTWSVSNNQASIISGQGTPMIQLEAVPGFNAANLSVVASNCKGNGSRAQKRLRVTSTAARLMSTPSHWSISVTPNPATGRFVLNTTHLGNNATLEIYSIEGRLVHQQTIPALTTQTSIELNQPSGLYQVRVVAGEEVKTTRVVIQ